MLDLNVYCTATLVILSMLRAIFGEQMESWDGQFWSKVVNFYPEQACINLRKFDIISNPWWFWTYKYGLALKPWQHAGQALKLEKLDEICYENNSCPKYTSRKLLWRLLFFFIQCTESLTSTYGYTPECYPMRRGTDTKRKKTAGFSCQTDLCLVAGNRVDIYSWQCSGRWWNYSWL